MLYRKILTKTFSNLTFSHRRSSYSCCKLSRSFSDSKFTSDNNDLPEDSKAAEVAKLLDDATTFSDAKDPNWAKNPYPDTAPVNLQKEPEAPKVLPNDNSIILFPGQGTLKIGKIKSYLRFPRVREMYSIANEILKYDLKKLSLEGPQKELNKTEFNQAATVVASLAALENLIEDRPNVLDNCRAVAGYSVGEFTALIFSGAIDFESGIRLVQHRAQAMANAAKRSKQGMMYVYTKAGSNIFQACKDAESWARDLGISEPVCRIAIYLHTQGKVIGGNDEALNFLMENSAKFGLKNIRRIPVSGAFHTPLMEPAIKHFKAMLYNTIIEKPRITVYANCNAEYYREPETIRKSLVKHLVQPVKWEQIIHKMYERPAGSTFPRTFDVGSDGTLKNTLKLINSKAWDWCYTV